MPSAWKPAFGTPQAVASDGMGQSQATVPDSVEQAQAMPEGMAGEASQMPMPQWPAVGGTPSKLRNFFSLHSGYSRHPRNSAIWRWWRPLITSPLAILYFVGIIFVLIVIAIGTGLLSLETIQAMSNAAPEMDQSELFFSPFGALLMLGGLAGMTLALASALWTSRERPFGTVVSVFGHIRPKMLLRAIPFAFVSLLIPMLIEVTFLRGGFGHAQMMEVDPYVLVMLAVFLPLQCVAEEVVFRGYIMQTLASWFPKRLFVLALVGQAVLFMLGHAYDLPGQVAILCTGLIYGWLAEKTGGLETGMAFHIANNVLVFALMFTGLSKVTAQVSMLEGIIDGTATILMPLLFVLLGMKMGWIDDAETIAAGEGPCRMFGSQSDALMWERIQREQLADWNRFMSEMPAIEDSQGGNPGTAFLPEPYVDGEGVIVDTGEGQYDDKNVSVMGAGAQGASVVPDAGAWASQQDGMPEQAQFPHAMPPMSQDHESQGTQGAYPQGWQPVAQQAPEQPLPETFPQAPYGMTFPVPSPGSPVQEFGEYDPHPPAGQGLGAPVNGMPMPADGEHAMTSELGDFEMPL